MSRTHRKTREAVESATEYLVECLASDVSMGEEEFDVYETLKAWEVLTGLVGWMNAYVILVQDLTAEELINDYEGYHPEGGWTAACLGNFTKMMEETCKDGTEDDPHAEEYAVRPGANAADKDAMIADVKKAFKPDKVRHEQGDNVVFYFNDALGDEGRSELADCVEGNYWVPENF